MKYSWLLISAIILVATVLNSCEKNGGFNRQLSENAHKISNPIKTPKDGEIAIVLVQNLLPGYCRIKKGMLNLQHMDKSVLHNPHRWVIYGSWPEKKKANSSSEKCHSDDEFNLDELNSVLKDRMYNIWTNKYYASGHASYWQKQWEAYGAYACDIKAMNGMEKYFRETVSLYDGHNMNIILGSPKSRIKNPGHGKFHDFQNEIKKVLREEIPGVKVQMKCCRNPNNKKQYLDEIRICFNKQLETVDCKNSTGDSSTSATQLHECEEGLVRY